MGFWLTVGRVAASAGVRALNGYARGRLEQKASTARVESDMVADAAYWAARRRAEKKEAQERAKAKK